MESGDQQMFIGSTDQKEQKEFDNKSDSFEQANKDNSTELCKMILFSLDFREK